MTWAALVHAWQQAEAADGPAGANAIPVDIFHSKSTAAAMRQLVDTAVDANMNMIRIWGGGMYYRDDFYDYCDRAGMLVWQEAMFACSLYPADADFLDNVPPLPLLSFHFRSPVVAQRMLLVVHALLVGEGATVQVHAARLTKHLHAHLL